MKYQIQGLKVASEPFAQLLSGSPRFISCHTLLQRQEKAVPGSASELVWSSSWKRGMKPKELWLVRRGRSAPSTFNLAEGSGGGECLLPEGYRNHSCHKNSNLNQQRFLPTWCIPRRAKPCLFHKDFPLRCKYPLSGWISMGGRVLFRNNVPLGQGSPKNISADWGFAAVWFIPSMTSLDCMSFWPYFMGACFVALCALWDIR